MTIEGAVVRIADVIAYVGRDIEDAITIGLISREEIPSKTSCVLGTSNDKIINTLVLDLIEHSYDKPYLEFSDDVFRALGELKDFNYARIYRNPRIHTEKNKITRMFRELFLAYCRHITDQDTSQDIYSYHLNEMGPDYIQNTPIERQVVDFMSGMTDDFFNNQYTQVFVPRTFGYHLR